MILALILLSVLSLLLGLVIAVLSSSVLYLHWQVRNQQQRLTELDDNLSEFLATVLPLRDDQTPPNNTQARNTVRYARDRMTSRT